MTEEGGPGIGFGVRGSSGSLSEFSLCRSNLHRSSLC